MPHLILEHSANVACPADLVRLFDQLHHILSATGGIRRENCKSRRRIAEDFLVGSGGPSSGFVHLDIHFLEGRSPEVKDAIGKESLDLLLDWFRDAATAQDLQITVEIRDIQRSSYFKHPPGTFTPQ